MSPENPNPDPLGERPLTADLLAQIVFAHEHRSRRKAKQLLRDHGLPSSAVVLDAILSTARTGPLREQVAARVAELNEDADRAAQANDIWRVDGSDLAEWIVGEAADDFRWYIIHTAEPAFIAEVVDSDEAGDAAVAAMDDDTVLACVRWIGIPPSPERAAELFRAARRAMRAYDLREEN